MDDVRLLFARNGLYRSRDERLLGGVCAGLGDRLGLAPGTARLLFLLVLLLVPGSQVVVYPLLWWLMPLTDTDRAADGVPGSYGPPPPFRT